MSDSNQRNAERTLLVISQVYPPDPASVGQHMHDAAAEMARRGRRVVVLTSRRGYDDPSQVYPGRERRDGVEIVRLPLSSFGKKSIPIRLLGAAFFLVQCILHGLFTRRLNAILVSTSPPMASIAAIVVGRIRRAAIKFWVMDVNPDQMIAMEKVGERSPSARVFNALNRAILKNAADVIALDRFMADRLCAKRDVRDKLWIIPPWPHEDHLEPVIHDDNPFRREHGLEGKFVVMYSGNHSPANPIDTVLDAALRMQDRHDLVFMFIGGGLAKQSVDDAVAQGAANIVSLPYQPISKLRYSLSAADAHVVTIGQGVVGIVHPCKIYGAMAVARPTFFVGPEPSHISDLLEAHNIGWRVAHGDVDEAVRTIDRMRSMDREELTEMGRRAHNAVREQLSKESLCGRFCDILDGRAADRPRVAASPSTERDDAELAASAPSRQVTSR